MGLQSALSTALTGMTAAETSIDVVGNNVANANTVGFKESNVNFATQFLQTQSIGSAPTGNRGGTNPRQTGLGVKVAEISPEFTQGTIEISSNPLDLAIQGDGFFMVQGAQGETYYTRNGQFKTNARNEIVTITGQRILGYGVDENYEIQPTHLVPLRIPLGAAAVAQATENVALGGNLNPLSAEGSIPEVIQSGILSDGTKEVPVNTTDYNAVTRPIESTLLAAGAAGSVDVGAYSYKITWLDDHGNETPASKATAEFTVGGVSPANSSVDLTSIPQPPSGSIYTQMRIYRANSDSSVPANTVFREVFTGAPATTYNDAASDASIAGNTALSDEGLTSGSFSYYVTYYNSTTNEESRPTQRIGPVSVDATGSPRVLLQDIPRPSNDPLTGGYDGIRIYRNTITEQANFYLVDTLTPADVAAYAPGDPINFIDSSPDAAITGSGAQQVNLDGPEISFGLPLVEVVSRDGSNYVNLFEEGELKFAGEKGDRALPSRTLTITSTTTVQDLISFMEQSMGVIKTAPESTFPGSIAYGGTITDSKLQFTSNLGVQNALGINLTSFQLTPTGGVAEAIPLPFSSINVDPANGEGATAEVVVYDSLGSPLSVRITTVLEESSSTGAKFRWIATSADHHPEIGVGTVVGTGVITTDSNGRFVAASNNQVTIDRGDSPAASPLAFELDFSQVTGLHEDGNKLNAEGQDGFPAGTLTSFIITDSGNIQGVFSNGSSRDLGQLRMATFANPGGLEQLGENLFAAGVNSGLPIQGDPGEQGIGSITAGAVELSNSDIGQNLIELILASTQYRGGARVITAVQQLLDELLALRR
jgi:flagellar hook protein FlgE